MNDEQKIISCEVISGNRNRKTCYNRSNNHSLDLNCLQVFDVITRNPEFSFLIRYYNLLYQSLIPNCKLTIKILKQHLEISSDVENFIVNGESLRIRCQRIINLLLLQLNKIKDYEQLRSLLNSISVAETLPDKLNSANVHKTQLQNKRQQLTKHVTSSRAIQSECYADDDKIGQIFSAEISDCKADKCCHPRRRCLIVTAATSQKNFNPGANLAAETTGYLEKMIRVQPKVMPPNLDLSFFMETSDQELLENTFPLLCNILPDDYQTTMVKLKSLPQLSTEDYQQLGTIISSPSCEVQLVNEKIVTFLVIQLCYNGNGGSLVELCNMMDNLVEPELAGCVREVLFGVQESTQLSSHTASLVELPSSSDKQDESPLHRVQANGQLSLNTASVVKLPLSSKQDDDSTLHRVQEKVQSSSHTASVVELPLSSDQQDDSALHNQCNPFYHMIFSNASLDPNSKEVSPVLKRNYIKLSQCLPQDTRKTIYKLMQMDSQQILKLPDGVLNHVGAFSSTKKINETIICILMARTRVDTTGLDFCDILECLVESENSRKAIQSIRNDLLEAASSITSMTPDPQPAPVPSLPNHTSNAVHTTGFQQSPNVHGLESSPVTNPVSGTLTKASASEDRAVSSTHVLTAANQPSGAELSKDELKKKLEYELLQMKENVKRPPPPTLPSNYVCRQDLLNEMVKMLCQSTIVPNSYETSLTVTGAPGFGKTSIVTALCHHPVIKEHFTDGFVFIELGPQANDPSTKLKGLYYLLTDKECDANVAEQKINQLTNCLCKNLLVIVDDVWHVEDAEPIVKAFSSCKIVLTTRMNNIEQYLPTKHVVTVGPMEQSEAISLLTSQTIDISQLSQEDVSLLNELAQDVHLWPLLLSLIRGQLRHNLRDYNYHESIQHVQTDLRNRGLTAFDSNNITKSHNITIKSRKYAVQVCMQATLNLLSKKSSDKLKTLILYTGIGTSLSRAVLHALWKVAEHEARTAVKDLWIYGLLRFSDNIIPPHGYKQKCVEVHAVISHYIIQNMEGMEVYALSPVMGLNTYQAVEVELTESFYKLCNLRRSLSAPPREFLKERATELESCYLPMDFRMINMQAIIFPHFAALTLQFIEMGILHSQDTSITMLFPSLLTQISSLVNECRSILRNSHNISREISHKIQESLHEKNYDHIIKIVEDFCRNYPLHLLAKKAVELIQAVIPSCSGKLKLFIKSQCEQLIMMTAPYSYLTLQSLSRIALFIRELKHINSALESGSTNLQRVYQYYSSLECDEDRQSLEPVRYVVQQEVAPIYVHYSTLLKKHGMQPQDCTPM